MSELFVQRSEHVWAIERGAQDLQAALAEEAEEDDEGHSAADDVFDDSGDWTASSDSLSASL